jgi:hypothetical protein
LEPTAALSTVLITSTTVVEQTNVLSTDSVETTNAVSESAFTTFYSSTIRPTDTLPAPVLSPTNTPQPSPPMANSAKVGIAIVVVLMVTLIAVGVFFFVRWRKRAIERKFEELKEEYHGNRQSPEPRAVPLYPRAEATVVGGVEAYRDVFDKPRTPR